MPRASRKLLVLALDATLVSASYCFAFWLRLGWPDVRDHARVIETTLPVVLLISLVVHIRLGLVHEVFRYASMATAKAILKATTISVLFAGTLLFLVTRMQGIPRSVFIIYFMVILLALGGSRLAFRLIRRRRTTSSSARPVLLYGLTETTERVLRGFEESRELDRRAVGIVDDNPVMAGRQVRGVKIYDERRGLESILEKTRPAEIWVCIPDLIGDGLRKIYQATSGKGVPIKTVPKLKGTLLGSDLARLQEPDIADLLRRPKRNLDRTRVEDWVRGRRVLVTGAGGSIGTELVRQVLALDPASVALCEACEHNLYRVQDTISTLYPNVKQTHHLVDVRGAAAVRRMLAQTRPEIIFHAAAYKHVPIVEENPCEAIINNIQGLYNVAVGARNAGVDNFVFISTDKAVRPVNVMGITKRLGEVLCQSLEKECNTCFSSVRFGNVLGSSGSVVPKFKEQIRQGGPVTVTHPDMTRYFMLVSEAVELVLQAGSVAKGGEIFVLDMGEPVRVSDMALDLIRLMGKTDEVSIEYTGIRPGEKLFEELLIDGREFQTKIPEIWLDARSRAPEWRSFQEAIVTLLNTATQGDQDASVASLQEVLQSVEPRPLSLGGSRADGAPSKSYTPLVDEAPVLRGVFDTPPAIETLPRRSVSPQPRTATASP